MRRAIHQLQERWRADDREVLDAGIGINTGEVVVGNIGAKHKRMDYTIIGDHVNLCARRKRLTRQYNAGILITEFTLSHLPSDFLTEISEEVKIEEIGVVMVKGRKFPVKIYNVTVNYQERH
jgi:adenylate cyclase